MSKADSNCTGKARCEVTQPVEYIFAPADVDGSDGLLGIVIRKIADQVKEDEIKFFTSKDISQQVGIMRRKRGHVIPPHIHGSANRIIHNVPETLLIQSGRVLVNFYTTTQQFVTGRILDPGDVVILLRGGHGFTILEDCQIYEVRQGPYLNSDDKIPFNDPKSPNAVTLL